MGDTDTVPDMVLVDMEVTVLVLPATEVTDLDTVFGRDPLMPIPKLGEPLDTDTVPDMVLVEPAMEVTELDTDMDTESNFYTSNNLLPVILIIPTKSKRYSVPQKQNQILFRHVSSKVEEEF